MCLCIHPSESVDAPGESVNKVSVSGEVNLHIRNQEKRPGLDFQSVVSCQSFPGLMPSCGLRPAAASVTRSGPVDQMTPELGDRTQVVESLRRNGGRAAADTRLASCL